MDATTHNPVPRCRALRIIRSPPWLSPSSPRHDLRCTRSPLRNLAVGRRWRTQGGCLGVLSTHARGTWRSSGPWSRGAHDGPSLRADFLYDSQLGVRGRAGRSPSVSKALVVVQQPRELGAVYDGVSRESGASRILSQQTRLNLAQEIVVRCIAGKFLPWHGHINRQQPPRTGCVRRRRGVIVRMPTRSLLEWRLPFICFSSAPCPANACALQGILREMRQEGA